VWSVLGALAVETDRLVVGTGVTCPTLRLHPAIVAQAAATTAAMFDGRFFLGVGTGENLNEHVLGHRWPPPDVRREMLAEAIDVIRALWQGELVTHRGTHYTVENARLYTLPDGDIPLVVAAGGPKAAELAGARGDGLCVTSPDSEVLDAFSRVGGGGKPRFGQLTVCVADSEAEAVETALEWWPNGGLEGTLSQELPLPSHFEAAAAMVTPDLIRKNVVCPPDPAAHVDAITAFVEAGVDHVYVHQVGPRQDEAIAFYEREVMPLLELEPGAALGSRVEARST
jgi:G6PDH family F420-dependent oxidoreductase